jgi:hypothetical protein
MEDPSFFYQLKGIFVNLIIPATGVVFYSVLLRQMREQHVKEPPTAELFVLFATYGGLLTILLTCLLWEWSGMAWIGLGYAIVIAPFVTLILATITFGERTLSKYHRWAWYLEVSYIPMCIATLAISWQIAKWRIGHGG